MLEYRTPVDTSELLSQISLAKLHTIYKMILKRQEDKIDPIRSRFGKIEKEEVSLPDKMTYVEQFAVKKRRFSFRDLLESQPGKVHVIVTFLAILELMKTGKIRISQEELFGDILIESLEDEDTVVVPYTDETDSEDKTDGRTEKKLPRVRQDAPLRSRRRKQPSRQSFLRWEIPWSWEGLQKRSAMTRRRPVGF